MDPQFIFPINAIVTVRVAAGDDIESVKLASPLVDRLKEHHCVVRSAQHKMLDPKSTADGQIRFDVSLDVHSCSEHFLSGEAVLEFNEFLEDMCSGYEVVDISAYSNGLPLSDSEADEIEAASAQATVGM